MSKQNTIAEILFSSKFEFWMNNNSPRRPFCCFDIDHTSIYYLFKNFRILKFQSTVSTDNIIQLKGMFLPRFGSKNFYSSYWSLFTKLSNRSVLSLLIQILFTLSDELGESGMKLSNNIFFILRNFGSFKFWICFLEFFDWNVLLRVIWNICSLPRIVNRIIRSFI